jgi:hypothetical protein
VPEAITHLNTEIASSAYGLLAMTYAESGGIKRADEENQEVAKLAGVKATNSF